MVGDEDDDQKSNKLRKETDEDFRLCRRHERGISSAWKSKGMLDPGYMQEMHEIEEREDPERIRSPFGFRSSNMIGEGSDAISTIFHSEEKSTN